MNKNKKYSICLCAVIFYILALFVAVPTYSATLVEGEKQDLALEVSEDYDDIYADYENYEDEEAEIYDPFEKWNRKIFAFNIGFNKVVVEPIGKGYRKVTTAGIRKSIDNFVKNLDSPIILMNSVLQFDGVNAAKTVGSFAVNTTVGVLGLFNPARLMGIYRQDRDFGQTLGKWRVGPGPYLVVPVLGPNTLRDGTGDIVDILIDPLNCNKLGFGGEREPLVGWEFRAIRLALYGLTVSDFVVETFTPMIKSSFDPYVMARNAFMQSRNYKINK